MTDPDDFDNDPADDDGSDHLRVLRAKAKRADELERKIADMERREAFRDAGVNLNDPKMTYFVKGYEGDTDPAAIRQAAIDAGFLENPNAVPDSELAAHERVTSAASGAEATTTIDLADAFKTAKSADEVLAMAEQAGLATTRNRSYD